MTCFNESDEDEEEEANVAIQAEQITEFSSTTQHKLVPETTMLIPKLNNTFRRTGRGYRPSLLHKQEEKLAKTYAELECNERNRNEVYGLSKVICHTDINLGPKHESIEPLVMVQEEKGEKLSIQSMRGRFAADHPDMSSLSDYHNVPVEGFGLAMLRGMGYVPPPTDNMDSKKPGRRPDFLGLGATERPDNTKLAADSKLKSYQQKIEQKIYVPLVKRNKRTGNLIDEPQSRERFDRHAHRSIPISIESDKGYISDRSRRQRRGSRSPSRRFRELERRYRTTFEQPTRRSKGIR